MLNQDPVTLYGPKGKVKSIPAIDAPGWIAAGWSAVQNLPHSPLPLIPTFPTPSPPESTRENFATTDEQAAGIAPKRRGKNGANTVSEN